VSFSLSQGAVASQARRRTIASFTRTDIPGFIRRSRTIPLRLFRRPMTATRSCIGVTPTCCPGPAPALGSCTRLPCASSWPRWQEAARSSPSNAPVDANRFTLSLESRAGNRRSKPDGARPWTASHPAGRRPSCRSGSPLPASRTSASAAATFPGGRRSCP